MECEESSYYNNVHIRRRNPSNNTTHVVLRIILPTLNTKESGIGKPEIT